MKTRAFILLFPFAVYLAETVHFPQEANKGCKKMSCMKMKMPMKCHDKKDDSEKPSGKCNNNPDCTFCPVCYTFTFLTQYELTVKYTLIEKNYLQITSGYITSYIPPVWKPPNTCILSSQLT
jgi:hypothetical protein